MMALPRRVFKMSDQRKKKYSETFSSLCWHDARQTVLLQVVERVIVHILLSGSQDHQNGGNGH